MAGHSQPRNIVYIRGIIYIYIYIYIRQIHTHIHIHIHIHTHTHTHTAFNKAAEPLDPDVPPNSVGEQLR